MLVGEIDAAHEVIALPYHPDFTRRLDEIHGLEKKELAGHAPGPAARLGDKGKRPLAAYHLIVRGLHLLRSPRFQDRILRVHDRGPEFATGKAAILNLAIIRIVGIGLDWSVSRTRRSVKLKIPEVHVPAKIPGTQLGNRILPGGGQGKRWIKDEYE